MYIGSLFVTDSQSTKLVEPSKTAFYDPSPSAVYEVRSDEPWLWGSGLKRAKNNNVNHGVSDNAGWNQRPRAGHFVRCLIVMHARRGAVPMFEKKSPNQRARAARKFHII